MTCARPVRSLRRARLGRRLAAIAVATTLMGSTLPASAFVAPDAAEIERLYVEGQDQYAAKKFKEAADTWTRLLDMLPESGSNQATRENILINVLQARLDAYRRLRNDDGTKQIEHLRDGKKTLDKYYADFQSVHGDSVAVSAAVQEKGDELEQELTKAEEELAAAQGTGDGEGDGDGDQEGDGNGTIVANPNPTPTDFSPQRDGTGLIIAGGVTAGLGLIALVTMVPIGVVRGNQAEEVYMDALEDNDEVLQKEADLAGKQANQIAIAGAVLGPLLMVGGGVMLGLGFKQRSDARRRQQAGIDTFSPMLGRGLTGFAVRGRF